MGDFALSLGFRHEDIDGEVANYLIDTVKGQKQELSAASISGIWQVTDSTSLFLGAYEGFSPAGPASGANHEESLNYELGLRFSSSDSEVSVTGFYSDYDNLIGRCRVSDPNCVPGSEFNGGQVEITGVEFSALHAMSLPASLELEMALSYTYTESEFGETFFSGFSQWGLVRAGDELPYVPESTGNARVSFFRNDWSVEASLDFQSKMREVPGLG